MPLNVGTCTVAPGQVGPEQLSYPVGINVECAGVTLTAADLEWLTRLAYPQQISQNIPLMASPLPCVEAVVCITFPWA